MNYRIPKSRQDYYRENDNVYFNATITHPQVISPVDPTLPTIGAKPFIAQYQVNNDTPFLDNASEYYCSVIRFDIPLDAVPIFICPIIPNQINSNLTPFIIGVRKIVAGVSTYYPQNVQYWGTIYNPSEPVPLQNQITQVITPYYYVYGYTEFIRAVNDALALAWGPTGANYPVADTPYFFLDPATELIKLTVSPTLGSPDLLNRPIIYMNSLLENYFSAFSTISFGWDNPNGHDFEFATPQSPFLPHQQYSPAGWGIISQIWPMLPLWSSIRKILVISNRLPINAESEAVGLDTNSTRIPILADFVPQINNAGDSRQIAYYLPSAQYKLVDMLATIPLQSFDLRFYWEDAENNIFPLTISVYQQINIKLAFLRKDLYKKPIGLN